MTKQEERKRAAKLMQRASLLFLVAGFLILGTVAVPYLLKGGWYWLNVIPIVTTIGICSWAYWYLSRK